jgi:hypothetical protein
MISPFGVDHGEISKARRGATGGRSHPDPKSMSYRGGEGYTKPTFFQVAAAKKRRAQQAADSAQHKANKIYRRTGGGKKITLATHLKAAGKLPVQTAAAATVGGGALYVLNRKEPVEKSEKAKDAALGGAAGASLTYAGSNVAGQTAKGTLKARRAKRGESPHEARIWREHKAKYGNKGHQAYLKYPKELPDWKLQRALAVKNKPIVAGALLAGGTAAGAAYGVKHSRGA